MAERFKIPNTDQWIVMPGPHAHTNMAWYRYFQGIENLDIRVTSLETQNEENTADILDLEIRVQFIEAQQTIQNNRLDGLEAEVFGGSGGTGEFGDGFGAGFAVS